MHARARGGGRRARAARDGIHVHRGAVLEPGGFFLFSDMPGDTRRRWGERGGVTVAASPSNKGNGMTLDADGRLLVCEHVTSSVVRMDPDGTGSGREVLASHYEGKELNSPNDVIVADDGTIYFTDPTYGRMPGFGIEREQELPFQGVYRIAPGRRRARAAGRRRSPSPTACASRPDATLSTSTTPTRRTSGPSTSAPTAALNSRVRRRHRARRARERRPRRRDEARRARQRLGHRAGRRGVSARTANSSASIDVPENVGNVGWGGRTGTGCSSPRRPRCTASSGRCPATVPYMR